MGAPLRFDNVGCLRLMPDRVVITIDLESLLQHMTSKGVQANQEGLLTSLDNLGFERRADGLWECEEACLEVLESSEFRRIGTSA